MTTHERELTRPVDLCDGHGRLNDEARGWSRHPMLRANLRRAHGRKKKWDYWCVITDEVVVSFVHADVDYVGLANVWVMNHATAEQATAGVMVPFARRFSMPEQVCEGTVSHEQGRFALRITETPEHTGITARGTDPKAGDIEVDPMRPWRLTGDDGRIDLTLTPTFDRYDVTDVGVLKMEVHQCFGTWSGTLVDDDGTTHHLDGIRGFAEEARNRW